MKFENTQVMNFSGALRGMRNPKESWKNSDSIFGIVNMEWCEEDYQVAEDWVAKCYSDECEKDSKEWEAKVDEFDKWLLKNGILLNNDDYAEVAFIGPDDMRLAQQLIKAGPEHRKFLRQISVCVDITAPLYW